MEIKQFYLKIATLKNANSLKMEQPELIIVEVEQHLHPAIGANVKQQDIPIHFLVIYSPILSHSRTVLERMESILPNMVHSVLGVIPGVGMSHSNIVILKTTNQPPEQRMFISPAQLVTD
jgi:hypothetical protein